MTDRGERRKDTTDDYRSGWDRIWGGQFQDKLVLTKYEMGFKITEEFVEDEHEAVIGLPDGAAIVAPLPHPQRPEIVYPNVMDKDSQGDV